jgi:hypothetical protein
MISFNIGKRDVILEYEPEVNPNWVTREFRTHDEVAVSRAFIFKRADLLSARTDEEDQGTPVYRFHFASRSKDYFRIEGRKLGIEKDVHIADDLMLERKLFVAERNIRIFSRIAKVMQENAEIVIGGERKGAIPLEVFRDLIARFPNSLELDRYASARVDAIIGEFVDGMRSAKDAYEIYMAKRKPLVRDTPLPQRELLDTEIVKFEYVRDVISDWLANAGAHSEKDWQRMIVKVILLVLPKYVAVLENVEIADFYSAPGHTKKRFIDLCLVDAGGHVDVIEIKRPFDDSLLGKTLYRDNNVPTRELSGCIMQVEKYLFHLSKWGVVGEDKLSQRYSKRLPTAMPIRVTNPKAMIILGRDRLPDSQHALSPAQAFDLEVIKRKYANIIDILTYDDLLRRLSNIIAALKKRRNESP